MIGWKGVVSGISGEVKKKLITTSFAGAEGCKEDVLGQASAREEAVR